jgi:hypothetical protein
MTIQLTSAGNPFVVGEKPAPLVYTFKDSTGAVINLTGYNAKFSVRELYGVAGALFNAAVTGPTAGEATYTWVGGEYPTPGHYLAEMWVGNGTQRFCSERIEFDVRAPVGSVPSI